MLNGRDAEILDRTNKVFGTFKRGARFGDTQPGAFCVIHMNTSWKSHRLACARDNKTGCFLHHTHFPSPWEAWVAPPNGEGDIVADTPLNTPPLLSSYRARGSHHSIEPRVASPDSTTTASTTTTTTTATTTTTTTTTTTASTTTTTTTATTTTTRVGRGAEAPEARGARNRRGAPRREARVKSPRRQYKYHCSYSG